MWPTKEWPDQLGLSRRPALDRDELEAWELPDGRQYARRRETKLNVPAMLAAMGAGK